MKFASTTPTFFRSSATVGAVDLVVLSKAGSGTGCHEGVSVDGADDDDEHTCWLRGGALWDATDA